MHETNSKLSPKTHQKPNRELQSDTPDSSNERPNDGNNNPYFAAIDLGSNSFHLLVVKINDGIIETVDRVKEMVQIARGLKDKQLSQDAQERALHCLRCFQERIRDIPDNQIRVVGTKALRSASNANQFLHNAQEALGHNIDIISGYEEARLVYKGVSQDISVDKGRQLVIDIGGGSTEFIIGEHKKPLLMESLSIGCVTFSDAYFSGKNNQEAPELITSEMIWHTYYATCIELELITQKYCKKGWNITVGSSGTMKAVAQLMQEDIVTGVITREGLMQLVNHLHEHGKLTETENIAAQRRNVLPAGIIILSAIFDQLEINEIHVVETALKEGLIYDTIGRLSTSDARDQTVNKMMEQYQIDHDQTKRVERVLAHFTKKLPSPIVHGVRVEKISHWAAQLHEIGLSISHSGYHHHGHYLLSHSDMAGFSRFEQELLALLVGTHRRKIRTERLTLLAADNQQMLYPLVVCLRLAVLLNHRREDDIELPNIAINMIDKQSLDISLYFPDNWLKEHPLTLHNLSQEQRYLEPLNVTLHYQ